MTRLCGYLTMDNEDGWAIDSGLAFPHMEELGWRIESLPWRTAKEDWDRFDAVYVGTPWDYPEDPQHFTRVLEAVDCSRAVLVNDLALVLWNIPKTYLRDLEQRGARIVPSIWGEEMNAAALGSAFDRFGVDRIIVKPVISTNATDTFLLTRDNLRKSEARLAATFASRPFLIQPFIENIQSEGEYSLFYFNRKFSHGIRKVPKRGDFRVQEEFGADLVPVEPEATLMETGMRTIELVDPLPAYARADFVRGPDDRFLLMELELIEPSMYLRMDSDAPRRFAEAFDEYVRTASGGLEK